MSTSDIIAVPANRADRRARVTNLLTRYGTVLAAVVIFAVFALASGRFVSAANISNILVQISVLMVVSSGLTVAVASGEFDLSVGEVAGLSGVLVAGLMVWSKLPVAVAIVVPILAGTLIGVVNGLLVTRLRIPSLIATLAMGPIALGANYAYDGGDSIYARFPDSFYYIATGHLFGVVPVPIVIALAVVAVFYVLLGRTRTGRAIVATGANIQAARLSGISVNRCRILALALSAFGAAMGGVMLTARLGTGQPGDTRAVDPHHGAAPPRYAGGRGRAGGVPRLRRFGLCHRPNAECLRRDRAELTAHDGLVLCPGSAVAKRETCCTDKGEQGM